MREGREEMKEFGRVKARDDGSCVKYLCVWVVKTGDYLPQSSYKGLISDQPQFEHSFQEFIIQALFSKTNTGKCCVLGSKGVKCSEMSGYCLRKRA